MSPIDPEIVTLAKAFIARVKTGRAVTAVQIMLSQGFVTTDDLKNRGYEHPPRAIADVRDNGIPVVTEKAVSAAGKRMARYRFGTAENIREGQAGRTSFSKAFRNALLDAYGPTDAITGARHDPASLQIDHRVPYRVSGDAGLGDISMFMLLDAKSQRSKSWSCEHCDNFVRLLEADICRSCFWAFPERYAHVAMRQIRRADLVWQGAETTEYDGLARLAAERGVSIADLLKALGRREIQL